MNLILRFNNKLWCLIFFSENVSGGLVSALDSPTDHLQTAWYILHSKMANTFSRWQDTKWLGGLTQFLGSNWHVFISLQANKVVFSSFQAVTDRFWIGTCLWICQYLQCPWCWISEICPIVFFFFFATFTVIASKQDILGHISLYLPLNVPFKVKRSWQELAV